MTLENFKHTFDETNPKSIVEVKMFDWVCILEKNIVEDKDTNKETQQPHQDLPKERRTTSDRPMESLIWDISKGVSTRHCLTRYVILWLLFHRLGQRTSTKFSMMTIVHFLCKKSLINLIETMFRKMFPNLGLI